MALPLTMLGHADDLKLNGKRLLASTYYEKQADGSYRVMNRRVFSYDEQGRLQRMLEYDGQDSLVSESRYRYKGLVEYEEYYVQGEYRLLTVSMYTDSNYDKCYSRRAFDAEGVIEMEERYRLDALGRETQEHARIGLGEYSIYNTTYTPYKSKTRRVKVKGAYDSDNACTITTRYHDRECLVPARMVSKNMRRSDVFEYDNQGRLVTLTSTLDGESHTVRHTYFDNKEVVYGDDDSLFLIVYEK